MRPASLVCVLCLLTGCTTGPPTNAVAPGIDSLPSADRCPTDALPEPERTDGLTLSEYPKPPNRVNESTVADYVVAFERAYFRNLIIAETAADPEMNLTRVTVSAQVERVNRTTEGYTVVLAPMAGTNYASGIHGDRWPTVTYHAAATRLIRSRGEPPSDSTVGVVVLECPD